MLQIKNTIPIKIIFVLFGVFTTAVIFSLSIEIFRETGIWIGLILSIAIVTIGFYYTKKGDKLRLIAWSILISVLVAIILFALSLSLISKTFEGF